MSHPVSARLFIALDLPFALYEELHSWARLARGAQGEAQRLRLLEPESMHLTICFLGSRPVGEIALLAESLERCVKPLGHYSLGAPLWLPSRRPRALAVEVHDEDGGLGELQRRLLKELDAAGIGPHAPEHAHHRALRAHVTVARLGRGYPPRQRELPPTPFRAFLPERLTLYRSFLHPDGASYEALASVTTLPMQAAG